MLGKIEAKYQNYHIAENGDFIVSFAVSGSEIHHLKQTIGAIKTALAKGKERLDLEIDIHREKRSLDANNYFWQLCSKISEKTNVPKNEVYQKCVRECGICKTLDIEATSAETVIKAWSMLGTAWMAEKVDFSEKPNCVKLFLYYGSSVYSKKQMAKLINIIVDDCRELEIETRTSEEIADLISLWEASVKL